MQALNQDRDWVAQVEQGPEYETHRLFYKGLLVKRLFWRPAVYYSPFECDQCGSNPCTLCRLNRGEQKFEKGHCVYQYLQHAEAWIENYRHKLYQIREDEFQVIYKREQFLTRLFVGGIELFRIRTDLRWVSNCLYGSTLLVEILPDRLFCQIDQRSEPLLLFANNPFHKQILDQLRLYEPFCRAPIWF